MITNTHLPKNTILNRFIRTIYETDLATSATINHNTKPFKDYCEIIFIPNYKDFLSFPTGSIYG